MNYGEFMINRIKFLFVLILAAILSNSSTLAFAKLYESSKGVKSGDAGQNGTFTQEITANTSTGVAEVTFVGSAAAQFVILHYQVNNTTPQNVNMLPSEDSITWALGIANLQPQDVIT